MKRIREKFRSHGYDFQLLFRTEKIALYRKYRDNPDTGKQLNFFEVHLIRVRNGNFNSEEHKEELASASQFGTRGWSFFDLGKAMEKFEELMDKHEPLVKALRSIFMINMNKEIRKLS